MKSSWFLVLPIVLSILFFSVSSAAQEPDKKEMEQIYRDANLGDPKAQLYLGSMYGNGKGVPLDHAEAAKWYRKAAEQGYAKAQWYLGRAYYNGAGLPRDYAEAEKWYRKAADQGLAEAKIDLKKMLELGQLVHRDFAKADLDIAEAEKLYRKAAEQGNAQAQWSLGRGYYEGAAGLPGYLAEAEKWYRMAAEQGLAEAQVELGYMFWLGIGRPMDRAEAEKWFRKAAEQGNAKAEDYLQRVLRDQESARERESSETATWSLFAGIAILALMTIAITKRLRTHASDDGQRLRGRSSASLLHIPGFFLFGLLVMGPPQVFPVSASVPAILTMAAMLHCRSLVPAEDRQTALVLVLVSTLMWLCYGLYEYQMQQWARTVSGPIRVDLLILGPLLYISTLSLFRFWSWTNRHAQTPKDT